MALGLLLRPTVGSSTWRLFMATKTQQEAPEKRVLFPVVQNGLVGYINREGRIVVSPQLAMQQNAPFRVMGAVSIRGFEEGLVPVRIRDQWGYMDRHGSNIIEPQFEEAGGFQEGLAPVKMNGRWGFIDKTG